MAEAALVLLILVCAVLIASFGYGRDQGIFAVVARTIVEGGMPYRDAWDFKPPGIYLIYAFSRALFGHAEHAIRMLEAAGMLATGLGLITLARRWYGSWRIGLVAAALSALVHAQLDFWHSAQPESFGGMLIIAGLVVGTKTSERPWRRYLVSGFIFGFAGLLKPPLAGAGAVFALWACREVIPRPRSWSWQGLQPVLWVLLGGVTPFALCLGWFGWKGALSELYQTLFVFTPHYTALGWHDRSLSGLLYQAFTQWFSNFSSVVTIGLLLSLAQWRALRKFEGTSLSLGVIAIVLAGVALQGKFFPYHYAAIWPVTCLLAAFGWHRLAGWALARSPRAAVVVAVLALFSATLRTATKDVPGSFWERSARRLRALAVGGDRATFNALASVADVNAESNRAVAKELAARVPIGGSVYIWGFEPVIYDLSERAAACHYIYNVPQRVPWAMEEARGRLMQHLRARRPDAIVVVHHDVFPMVTGNGIGSADVMKRDFEALRTFIAQGYRKLKRVQDFDIYLRR